MLELDEIIRNIKSSRSVLSEEDLRKLPFKKAFVYGRVSTQGQVRDSHESIKDVAKLVMLAKKDGYHTQLDQTEIERWLQSIQNGESVSKVIEDGDVVIDCRDLGLSGSLGEDKRPGLAALRKSVEIGEVGAIYLNEGMSRLSRDRDRILGYKLLKLLKEQKCRIRVLEGIYNPAIPRDWDNLADDIEDSAEEMKKFGIRLGRRRASKAAEGLHVGSPVCPGYIVKIEGQRNDGSYIMGKWKPYPPHQEVVITALTELVKQRSIHKTVSSLHSQGIVFPFFPPELKYMETRSALRCCHKNDKGYLITTNTLKTLATNLKTIGVWQWLDVLIENNHPPIVSHDLFLQAYEIAARTGKPKGRAANAEPMDWHGLLYCYEHEPPRSISAYNAKKRWACNQDYHLGVGYRCLYIEDHLLTPPLTTEFLRCLDLTPHAQAVLEKLKDEVNEYDLEESRYRKRETELKNQITNLERYLGAGDPEREETYWRLIKEARDELQKISHRPTSPKSTDIDIEKVTEFLENLEENWKRYPNRLRNRLITLLIDRVELRHDRSHVEATIVWKIGFRQVVDIQRKRPNYAYEKRWRKEEDDLLRMLWPSASWDALFAALPERTRLSLSMRACKLRLSRQGKRKTPENSKPWTETDNNLLKDLYIKGVSINEIATKLARTEGAIEARLSALKIKRPKEYYRRKVEPVWHADDFKVIHELSSP